MITAGIINGIWNYYLSLEKDLDDTSRYIEPKGQENVFSFEFAKLLVLSCTELESVLKLLCYECSGEKRGNIGEYKETILTYYPKIVFAEVNVSRWGETIRPFDGWDKENYLGGMHMETLNIIERIILEMQRIRMLFMHSLRCMFQYSIFQV